MELARTIAEVRAWRRRMKRPETVLGFVPTMGALHAGHGALIDRARAECDLVAVSIFVNPIQFNRADDYQRYPRDLEADLKFCEGRGVDLVFAPSEEEMYPQPLDTYVEVHRLTDHLCGAYRPGHFRGVTTVVTKLFHIVEPDRAYFGEKDAQQLAVIRRMVRDLNFPVEVVPVPTVREPDGLAMSSRNQYLNASQRVAAAVLFRGLQAALAAAAQGERRSSELVARARQVIQAEPAVQVEYLEVVDAEEMQPVDYVDRPVRIAVAAWVGPARLIDNVLFDPGVGSASQPKTSFEPAEQ